VDTERFFREHGYYPTKNIPQTDAEREQFFFSVNMAIISASMNSAGFRDSDSAPK
jgi:hypothetical protein